MAEHHTPKQRAMTPLGRARVSGSAASSLRLADRQDQEADAGRTRDLHGTGVKGLHVPISSEESEQVEKAGCWFRYLYSAATDDALIPIQNARRFLRNRWRTHSRVAGIRERSLATAETVGDWHLHLDARSCVRLDPTSARPIGRYGGDLSKRRETVLPTCGTDRGVDRGTDRCTVRSTDRGGYRKDVAGMIGRCGRGTGRRCIVTNSRSQRREGQSGEELVRPADGIRGINWLGCRRLDGVV